MNDEELLTTSQAAGALSASSQTIRNWIRAEQLRAIRIGRRFLILGVRSSGCAAAHRRPAVKAPGRSIPTSPLSPSPVPANETDGALPLNRSSATDVRILRACVPERASRVSGSAAHVLAPPNAGFSKRVAALASAAAARAEACEAAAADGFQWPGARSGAKPPYELQPGTGRRGPDKLWAPLTKPSPNLTV
jgi:excisionase family DNA binding protein